MVISCSVGAVTLPQLISLGLQTADNVVLAETCMHACRHVNSCLQLQQGRSFAQAPTAAMPGASTPWNCRWAPPLGPKEPVAASPPQRTGTMSAKASQLLHTVVPGDRQGTRSARVLP